MPFSVVKIRFLNNAVWKQTLQSVAILHGCCRTTGQALRASERDKRTSGEGGSFFSTCSLCLVYSLSWQLSQLSTITEKGTESSPGNSVQISFRESIIPLCILQFLFEILCNNVYLLLFYRNRNRKPKQNRNYNHAKSTPRRSSFPHRQTLALLPES